MGSIFFLKAGKQTSTYDALTTQKGEDNYTLAEA
jgi:hypothetical protein